MNYLAHGFRFSDQPYFLAGTAAPDWLSVIDRKMRLRSKTAGQFAEDEDPRLAALARGVMQHHHDDEWFHQTAAFNELNLQFAVLIRDHLPADDGFRPSFLGHILVELLLDSTLAEDAPVRLDNYYQALAELDAALIQQNINRLATRSTDRLQLLLPKFCSERFLYDYLDDSRLLMRLNHVMRRVGLPPIPEELTSLLPAMRNAVRSRQDELLPAERMHP